MFDTLKKLNNLLERSDRFRTLYILIISVFMSLLEVVGIGLVFPFLKVVSNPDAIVQSKWLKRCYSLSGVADPVQFTIILGVIFASFIVFKNIALLFLNWTQSKIFKSIQLNVSRRMMSTYVQGSYLIHTQVNSSDILKILSKELEYVFGLVLHPIVTIVSESFVVLGIIAVLAIAAPLNTLVATALFLLVAFLIYHFTKKKAQALGVKGQEHLRQYMRWVNQSINGIEEVKLTGSERFFTRHFGKQANDYLSTQVVRGVLNFIPRFMIESIFILGVTALILLNLIRNNGASEVMSLAGLFAVAAMRLMPGFNRILLAATHAKYHSVSVDLVYNDFQRFRAEEKQVSDSKMSKSAIHFRDTIQLQDISFKYPARNEQVLNGISFAIQRGETIGLAGGSGSGKSTLARIILGLFKPDSGSLLVDGQSIDQESDSWRKLIGYVPQTVYLCDDTIRANVAFGVDLNEIDDEQLWDSLRRARLADFVESLPNGTETMAGERGVALSGGQRQRLGIARALYRNPQILVLDEATSSLDNETEKGIEATVAELRQNVTCIIIAHRTSTIKICERIIYLKNGSIQGEGTFEELHSSNPSFRKMVGEAGSESLGR